MEVHPGFLSQWRPLRLSPTPCHDHTMITPTSPEQMLPQNPQDKAAFVSPAAPKPTNTTRTTSTSPHRCVSQNLPDVSRTGTAAAVLPRLTFGSIRPLSRVWGADSYRQGAGGFSLLLWSLRAVRISQAYQHSECTLCELLSNIFFCPSSRIYLFFSLFSWLYGSPCVDNTASQLCVLQTTASAISLDVH